MSEHLLNGLNQPQYEAVTADDGPVLVLAGPGSGKTGVLTRRVAYLISERQVKPWDIMAVTFTNKAAGEMRQRIENYLGGRVRGLQVGTFHATCAKILRMESQYTPYGEDYVIYDSDDQLAAVTQAMSELNLDTKKFTPRRVHGAISAAKNEALLPQTYIGQDYFTEIVARVYPRYQSILLDSNAMDFDDLLLQMVLALKNHEELRQKYQQKYPYVLVDEFQDTNMVQYQLVQLFGQPQNNIFAVGDEDQSIYAFRGADYRNVLRFRDDYPNAQVILLEQNYRSTQIVLDVARAVIDKNMNRTPKALFTERTDGERITMHEAYDDDYESRYIMDTVEGLRRKESYNFSDFAIMYRTNAQSRVLEEAAVRMGVPYTLVGGVGFYSRREIRDLIAYLRVIHNPDDRISFARIINAPKRSIGKKSLEKFQYWAAQEKPSYGEALQHLVQGGASSLSKGVANKFAKFGAQLQQWQGLVETGNLVHLFDRMIADIGYHFYVQEISKTPEQVTDRVDNIGQLRGLIAVADDAQQPLGEFLADLMLMTDADNVEEGEDRVTMLTLHAAKGLEFPVVFITGLEDGLLPHMRSFEDEEGLAEERRLFYVGITRAEDRLYITHAFRRTMYGGSQMQTSSPFLFDVPPNLVKFEGKDGTMYETEAHRYREITTWDRPKSGLERLSEDLKAQRQSTPKKSSNSKIKGKIIQFPGTDTPPQHPTVYKKMMRVQHPVFGVGIVIESTHDGRSETVQVLFEDKRYGAKKLDAEFANMTILK